MSAAEPAAGRAADDDEVIADVKAGSVDALGVLYDRYGDRAYRIARSVCDDDGRAQEAVQETFISIWMTRGNYEQQRGKVAAWELTIARHRAIDIARRNQAHAAHRASDEGLHTLPAPASPAGTVKGRIRLGLQRLRGDIDRVAC